jgi:hypothetical protein
MEIVIACHRLGAAFPTTRERPDFDRRCGINGNAQDVWGGICLTIDLG